MPAHAKRNDRHAGTGSGSGTSRRNRNLPWPLMLIAAPAAVAVWSGWVGLGSLCGFGVIHPLPGIADGVRVNTDITLPVGIEAYGAYALYAWIAGKGSTATRTFARRSAIGALVLGCLGQVAFHLLTAGHWTSAPWPVVVLVACLPVVTLSFAAALYHLMHADRAAAEEAQAGAAAKAAARAAAKAADPAAPSGSGTNRNRNRNRDRDGTGTSRRRAVAAEPEPAETVDLDAEARILGLIAAGQLDAETGIIRLVENGRKPSKAGVLAGKSDSYGRKVVRTHASLSADAPKGLDPEGDGS